MLMWMIRAQNWMRRPFLAKRERGAAFTEYALLIALVAVVVVVAVTAFGERLAGLFDTLTGELDQAAGGP